jgi:hypothetical protein
MTSTKYQINSNDQNSKSQKFWSFEIGVWSLFEVWNLRFGILNAIPTLCAVCHELESNNDASLFKIGFDLSNGVFPIMKNGSREHGICLSKNKSFIKMVKGTHPS